MLHVKRVYEAAAKADGHRILVDRLWPRGLSKAKAAVDEWRKEIAPSTELRRWFQHDPAKWPGFQKRYRTELRAHGDALSEIAKRAALGPVTLLYGARDESHNEAVVLAAVLRRRMARARAKR
jgi:uncharacterized protein YeaO (DUF488 family)